MDVFPQHKSKAGVYDLRLFGTVIDKPSETAFTDFTLTVIYDPCYDTVVESEPIQDHDYSVNLANLEEIVELDWTQSKSDCLEDI